MKIGVFAMIPQLNAKVLNGSHQHQKAKKFVFKSQKWRQCLCVSMTASELFATSLSLRDKLSLDIFIWVFWNAYGRGFAVSGPSTQHQAGGFFFTTMPPVHGAVAVQEFLARKQVCVLNHPPYSPDLSPCDYFLFPKLKLPLKGHLFEDVQDIQGAVTSSLRAIPQGDVQRSFQSLLDRATRCIDAEGMYFE